MNALFYLNILLNLRIFSLVHGFYNIDVVIQFTYNLTKTRVFHNFIIFYSNNDQTWQNLTRKLQQTFEIPTILLNVDDSEYNEDKFHFSRDYNINALIYATVNPYEINDETNLNSNNMISSLNLFLRGIHQVLVIIIYDFPDLANKNIDINAKYISKTTYNLCKKLWRLKFYRIAVLITESIDYKLLTYSPFPKVNLIDITNSNVSNRLLFKKIIINVHKRAVRTAVYENTPRSLIFNNEKGQIQLSGSHLLLVKNFAIYINATFKNVDKNIDRYNANISTVLRLIEEKKVDFTGHATAINRKEFFGDFNQVAYSYPYQSSSLCVMVPFSKEIQQYLYTYLPFDPFVWLTIINFIFYITLIKIIILNLSPTNDDSKFIGSAFSTSISEVFFLPTSRPKKYHLNFIQMLLIILPYSLGFILSNVYMTKLSSYLTISLFEPQINSIEDLIKSNIKLFTSETLIKIILQNLEYKILEGTFEMTDSGTKKRYQSVLNTSFAYVIDDDKIEFYLSQQKYSKRPIFRKSQICFQKGLLAFFMPTDSIYKESFDYYIMKTSEAGLQYVWRDQSFIDAFKYGEGKFLYRDSSLLRHDLLRLNNVLGAFILWGSGCCLAILIFFTENLLTYFKNNCTALKTS